jgi:hypothetical protein
MLQVRDGNGVDLNTVHPGLQWWWQGSDDRGFRHPGGEHPALIEVYGEYVLVGHGDDKYLHADVVVTLRDKECELYRLLKAKSTYIHPSIGAGMGVMYFFAFVILAVVHMATLGIYAWTAGHLPIVSASVEHLFGLIPLVLVGSLILPIIELILLTMLYRLVKSLWTSARIHWFILRHISRARAKEILSGLTRAGNEDMRNAARNALRFYSRS